MSRFSVFLFPLRNEQRVRAREKVRILTTVYGYITVLYDEYIHTVHNSPYDIQYSPALEYVWVVGGEGFAPRALSLARPAAFYFNCFT